MLSLEERIIAWPPEQHILEVGKYLFLFEVCHVSMALLEVHNNPVAPLPARDIYPDQIHLVSKKIE